MVVIITLLAVFIGLPLLLVSMLLFIPIRYRMTADNLGAGAAVSIRVSWFLGFFRMRYENKRFDIWVMWFKRLKKSETRSKNKRKPKPDAAASRSSAQPSAQPSDKKPDFLKLALSALKHPDRPVIWAHLKTLIGRLLRAVKPKRFRASLKLGTGNPATTGYALGFLDIIRGVSGLNLSVAGDFTEKVLRYDVLIKDSLYICPLFLAVAVFCLKRPVWAVIKKLLKRDGNNGRKSQTVA